MYINKSGLFVPTHISILLLSCRGQCLAENGGRVINCTWKLLVVMLLGVQCKNDPSVKTTEVAQDHYAVGFGTADPLIMNDFRQIVVICAAGASDSVKTVVCFEVQGSLLTAKLNVSLL